MIQVSTFQIESKWRQIVQDTSPYDTHASTIEAIESRAQDTDETSTNAQLTQIPHIKVMMNSLDTLWSAKYSTTAFNAD